MQIHDFYKTHAWSSCAKAYRRSVGGLCERCLARGLIVPAAEVHHKIKLTQDNLSDPTVALNWENLEALCKDCHLKEHSRKRYRIDRDGHVEI